MAAIVYSKAQLVERIVRHLNDNFEGSDFKLTTNEILLYIDSAIPFVMKGMLFEMAKVTGVIDIPEAYLVTYELPITLQDANTYEWYVTLPQPPLELPTGYDITRTYVADPVTGASQNAYPIKAKRVAYRDYMPKPTGFSFRLEGSTMFLKMNDGGSLLNYDLFVQMPISRTSDVNAPMNIPDGAIEPLFTKVIATIMQRYQIPQDTVLDNLAPGNKTS